MQFWEAMKALEDGTALAVRKEAWEASCYIKKDGHRFIDELDDDFESSNVFGEWEIYEGDEEKKPVTWNELHKLVQDVVSINGHFQENVSIPLDQLRLNLIDLRNKIK